MADISAKFSGEIFRKDYPIIIAQSIQQATFVPALLAFDSAGYLAGQVLGRNSVSGLYQKYNDAGASGVDVARGVLFESHASGEFQDATGQVAARMVIGGTLFKDKLTGLDSAAETDFGAKTIVDATGTTLLKF